MAGRGLGEGGRVRDCALGDLRDEPLEARGLADHEPARRAVADAVRVWHAARRDHVVARLSGDLLAGEVERGLAVEDVERLVLV